MADEPGPGGAGAGDEHRGELADLESGHEAGDDERKQDDGPEPELARVGGAGAHERFGVGRDVAHADAHEDPQDGAGHDAVERVDHERAEPSPEQERERLEEQEGDEHGAEENRDREATCAQMTCA